MNIYILVQLKFLPSFNKKFDAIYNMKKLQYVRLDDRKVNPSRHSFLHANISLCEEKKKAERKRERERKRRMD